MTRAVPVVVRELIPLYMVGTCIGAYRTTINYRSDPSYPLRDDIAIQAADVEMFGLFCKLEFGYRAKVSNDRHKFWGHMLQRAYNCGAFSR